MKTTVIEDDLLYQCFCNILRNDKHQRVLCHMDANTENNQKLTVYYVKATLSMSSGCEDKFILLIHIILHRSRSFLFVDGD